MKNILVLLVLMLSVVNAEDNKTIDTNNENTHNISIKDSEVSDNEVANEDLVFASENDTSYETKNTMGIYIGLGTSNSKTTHQLFGYASPESKNDYGIHLGITDNTHRAGIIINLNDIILSSYYDYIFQSVPYINPFIGGDFYFRHVDLDLSFISTKGISFRTGIMYKMMKYANVEIYLSKSIQSISTLHYFQSIYDSKMTEKDISDIYQYDNFSVGLMLNFQLQI